MALYKRTCTYVAIYRIIRFQLHVLDWFIMKASLRVVLHYFFLLQDNIFSPFLFYRMYDAYQRKIWQSPAKTSDILLIKIPCVLKKLMYKISDSQYLASSSYKSVFTAILEDECINKRTWVEISADFKY